MFFLTKDLENFKIFYNVFKKFANLQPSTLFLISLTKMSNIPKHLDFNEIKQNSGIFCQG